MHEVGSAVTNVAVGDTVILHPTPTCGLCRACRAGQDMHCSTSTFPGLDGTAGGMAEYLLTSARACVKLDPETRPEDVAALADADHGYHAVGRDDPAALPGNHLRGDRGRRARAHRHPVPGRPDRHHHHRGGP